MNKTIMALLPIEVPNSLYCFNIKESITCPNFMFSDMCEYEMDPVYEEDTGNYLKGKDCLGLLWEDNK